MGTRDGHSLVVMCARRTQLSRGDSRVNANSSRNTSSTTTPTGPTNLAPRPTQHRFPQVTAKGEQIVTTTAAGTTQVSKKRKYKTLPAISVLAAPPISPDSCNTIPGSPPQHCEKALRKASHLRSRSCSRSDETARRNAQLSFFDRKNVAFATPNGETEH